MQIREQGPLKPKKKKQKKRDHLHYSTSSEFRTISIVISLLNIAKKSGKNYSVASNYAKTMTRWRNDFRIFFFWHPEKIDYEARKVNWPHTFFTVPIIRLLKAI